MSKQQRFKCICSLSILFFLVGCSTFMNKPAIREDEHNLDNVQQIVQQNFNQLKTLRGWAKLSIEASPGSFQANAYILLKNPDSLYIKVEAFLGITVGTLFVDHDSFKVYSPFQNSFYAGSVDSLEASPVIPFRLSFQKLLQVISGLETLEDVHTAGLQRNKKTLTIYGKENDCHYRYLLDLRNGIVQHHEISDSQNILLSVEKFERIYKTNGVRMPRTITVQYPQKKQSVTLFYTELMVNQRIKPKEFQIKIPSSAVKIKV
jgi:outer membrane biogenesis lipoprotein LolB